MKADCALDKARKHKKMQLQDTYNLVVKKRKAADNTAKDASGVKEDANIKPRPAAAPARAHRSAKRVPLSSDHWLRHWEPNNDHYQHDKNPKPQDPPLQPRQAPPTRSFEVVYSRKRRRRLPAVPVQDDDARFRIVFTRKDRRSKVVVTSCSSSREFVSRIGFLDAHFLTAAADDDVTGLLVLVDTSCSGSSHRFLRLLLPVLRWMRQRQQSKVWNLTSFLSSAAIATIFSSHGLHFVKLQRRRESAWLQRTLMSCGWCELRDAKKCQPLLSVNFSALPSYFQSLHSMIALNSVYLPTVIRCGMGLIGGAEEMYPRGPSEAVCPTSTGDTHPVVDLCSDESHTVVQDFVPLEQAAGVVMHGLRLKKHQRKRSSMRHPLNWHLLRARFPDKAIGMKQSTVASQGGLKSVLTGQEISVEPVQPKPALEISLDLLENMDDSDVSTPMGSRGKAGFSFKSPMEHTSERLALSEDRQNMDSLHCNANLLIIQADRCWREEGATIMLESSNSGGWCVAVKIHGVTRISLKPSEQRFYVVNRFTHAYVWAVEDGWKLEFPDKSSWLLFKELHVEGRERNSQGKVIPIPGVHEISGGIEGIATYPFSRPMPDYIRVMDDEVGRALSRDSVYDLDSDDEQWVNQMNHADSDRNSPLKHISYEEFEKIITLFEKDAYSNPEGSNGMDQLLTRYPVLWKEENMSAVHEYWISKRKKKGAPLINIFQVRPVRRGQTSQKSSIKKKRSFKRQRSKTGRGKPGFFLQDNAEDAALLRVAEAERLAKQAVERAVCLRSRAQSLMENANLATYKSVMALRIAEAASISDPCRDIVSRTMD